MTSKRIAILFHKEDTQEIIKSSLISYLSKFWKEDGHEVIYLFGVDEYVPADILIVHVDLSIVPESYLEFTKKYPVVLNEKIKDIRKSTISQNLLNLHDNWNGRVIVKTNRNCSGMPELLRDGFKGKMKKFYYRNLKRLRLQKLLKVPLFARDYKVYDHLNDVPHYCFNHPELVVEKFTPEKEEDHYCIRYYYFLGDRFICRLLKSKSPIVKGNTTEITEEISEPAPQIINLKNQMQFDYGKFDYVVLKGNVTLIDANKTIGVSININSPNSIRVKHRYLAEGLYDYF